MKNVLIAAVATITLAFVATAEGKTRRESWRYDPENATASVWFKKPGGSLKVSCSDHKLQVIIRRTEALGVGDSSARPVYLTIDGQQFPPFIWHNEGHEASLTAPDPVDSLVDALRQGRSAQVSLTDKDGAQSHHQVSLSQSSAAIAKVRNACVTRP